MVLSLEDPRSAGWVDDRWQTALSADKLEQVPQTTALGELANLLGYQLSSEIAAWQRRQAADG